MSIHSRIENLSQRLGAVAAKKLSTAVQKLPRQAKTRIAAFLVRDHNAVPGDDPFHENFVQFLTAVNAMAAPRILELGARNISGSPNRRDHFPKAGEYVGVDILPGEYVDVVADVHELSEKLGTNRFDAVFCISLFEHVGMPWKVVLEINKVMRVGGLLFIATHPTWPAHELPWDFWRYSKHAFAMLLNVKTGFTIRNCVEGLPCSILPQGNDPAFRGLPAQPAYLGVSVIAEKTRPPQGGLSWPVSMKDLVDTEYPNR